MSLLLATQITAVATAVLAVFAVVTALFAFLAFRKQSAEVGLLQRQAGRDFAERRRAQAVKVFIAGRTWRPNTVRISNSSGQPIYDLAAWAEGADPVRLPVLSPGEEYPFDAGWEDADGTMPVLWLDFRDAAGLRWRVTSRGELGELP